MSLIDSNILIYHLNDVLPEKVEHKVEDWIAEGALLSVITRIEVLGYSGQTEDEFEKASRLVGYFTEVPLAEPIIQRAIGLRRRQSIRLGDAIIAASALEEGVRLVTRNTDDFKWIAELELVNPFEGLNEEDKRDNSL